MTQFSINKNQPKTKSNRNLIFWSILLAVSIGWIIVIIIPQLNTLLEQRTAVRNFEQTKSVLTDDINELKENLEKEDSKFRTEAAESLKKEDNLLPTHLDIEKISKSLEIYGLLSNNASGSNFFEISNLSFGTIVNDEELGTQVLPLNITFSSTEDEARVFVKYLQSNVLPISVTNGAEKNLKDFILKNPLPLTTIQNIDISDKGDENEKLKLTTLQLNLHGKPNTEKDQK